jgi:hypothetical protein
MSSEDTVPGRNFPKNSSPLERGLNINGGMIGDLPDARLYTGHILYIYNNVIKVRLQRFRYKKKKDLQGFVFVTHCTLE